MRFNNARLLIVVAVVALPLAGCGDDTSSEQSPPTTTTAITGEVSATTTTTLPSSATTDTPQDEGSSAALTLQDIFTPIATEPTESGPRPLLAWEAVSGAEVYEVMVLGADGTPYWAWSGTETQINVGGSDEPEALGAWVHEEMTWTVSAHGSDGEVLGLSAPSALQP